jgi:hexulose-6-phosphate isomerase
MASALPPVPSLSRRAFLCGGATALVAGHLLADDVPRHRSLKKGFFLSSFPDKKLPLIDQFKMIKEAGFEGVQPHALLDQEEVLRARDAAGLLIPSVAAGGETATIGNPDPAVRARAVKALKLALQDAKRYGASLVLAFGGGVDAKVGYAENWENSQAGIREALPVAEELGIRITIENVWNNFLLSPLEMMRYVDEFNSKWVGINFDIGNCMYVGWPEQWIHSLGRRIDLIHIKEFSRKKMQDEGLRKGLQVEYLEGDNNWPAIMHALDDVGFSGWAVCETGYRPAGIAPAERLRQISEKWDKIVAS